MTMTEQEFRNEAIYSVTMSHVKIMLERGLISEDEYWVINTKMKEKYRPISDGLVSEIDLISTESRALIGSERRRESG